MAFRLNVERLEFRDNPSGPSPVDPNSQPPATTDTAPAQSPVTPDPVQTGNPNQPAGT